MELKLLERPQKLILPRIRATKKFLMILVLLPNEPVVTTVTITATKHLIFHLGNQLCKTFPWAPLLLLLLRLLKSSTYPSISFVQFSHVAFRIKGGYTWVANGRLYAHDTAFLLVGNGQTKEWIAFAHSGPVRQLWAAWTGTWISASMTAL